MGSLSTNWNVTGIFMIALLPRHSLSYEEDTKLSFFHFENTDSHAERIDMQKFISKRFQAESGFFIKIFIELID